MERHRVINQRQHLIPALIFEVNWIYMMKFVLSYITPPSAIILTMLFLIFVGCANQLSIGSIPSDMQHYQYDRYKAIDDVTSAFQEAGSPIRQFEQGNIIDIPYRLTNLSLSAIQPALERSCLNMMGGKGFPKRGDNLRSSWYFLRSDGGPIVNFDSEVNRVVSLLKRDSKNNWAIPSLNYSIGSRTYLCTVYESNLFPEYANENLQKPLFLALDRCEFENNASSTFTGVCHWIIIRTPNLLDIVKQTRQNSEKELVKIDEKRKKSEEEYSTRRKLELEQRAIRIKEEQLLVKTIGQKICRTEEITQRKTMGYFRGDPIYEKSSSKAQAMITAFTENSSGSKIQIRISGMVSNGSNLDRVDGDVVLQNGAVVWDEAANWRLCY